jgi:hypothetical protein
MSSTMEGDTEPICAFQGCNIAVLKHANASHSEYCSSEHWEADDLRRETAAAEAGLQAHFSTRKVDKISSASEMCQVCIHPDPDTKWALTTDDLQQCHARRVHVMDGKAMRFCGRTCANAANSGSSQPTPICQVSTSKFFYAEVKLKHIILKQCSSRPVHIENGRPLQFCGRTCANAAKSSATTRSTTAPGPSPTTRMCSVR